MVLKPSPETMPSSADDLDDSLAHGEQTDDSHDPLSFEEYSACAKHRRSRLRGTTNPTPTHQAGLAKANASHAPSFEKTNHATTAVSRPQLPQTTAADQSHNNATETEDGLVERPRKKSRTVLEIPIWTQPGLARGQIPKTSWDRHWSRKHNPKARTFDGHGNKITTWREIQERQRREQGVQPRPRRGKDPTKLKSQENQSTDLTTVESKVKLEHTCLSDEVASVCPACAKEEERGCGALLEDDRIIDPAVARRLLPEHTCLSDSVAGPCVACERENETQEEDEIGFVGSTQQTSEPKRRRSHDPEKRNSERINQNTGVDFMGQRGGPPNSVGDLPDFEEDNDEEPEEYDWENNPNIPKPLYITKIIKYYSKRKPFTPEEDHLIVHMYEEQNKNWDDIMEAMRHRSRGQLQYRYYTALRSENWREKRAAVADAIKQQKLAEKAKRQKAAEAWVRSLSGSLFEKPRKKFTARRRNHVRKEEEDLEWEEWLKIREPLDPAFLPPPEDDRRSPNFFPTVPPPLGLSASGYGNSQTPPDPSHVPAWLYTEPVPSQIEGVPMEPATQSSRPYEWLYPKIYPYAQIYKNSKRSTIDHDSDANSSGDETLPECNDKREKSVPQESTSVWTLRPNSVHSHRDIHVDLHAMTAITTRTCNNCGLTKNKGYWRNAADGRRLCNTCGLYECKNGKPRPLGMKRSSGSTPKKNKDKRQSTEEEVILVPSDLPVFLPQNAREVNASTIPTSIPAGRIPSSLDAMQNSIYETDGALEEVDLI